jgi:endonuclease/exonuclease/phosphatase family metal-dependent hydrolase
MSAVFRVATYNIHKGVQGLGPTRRLEIHNLALAVATFDADVVCLQEVRQMNRREEQHFKHWPAIGQAAFLAPPGYESVYSTNAVTRHGEHGNALLSRWPVRQQLHEDMSDHRFEQRGLLHVELDVHGQVLHVLVLHLGLVRASRVRQLAQLQRYIERTVPSTAALLVAGDFNEYGALVPQAMNAMNLKAFEGKKMATFPARLPLLQLDYVFARGLVPRAVQVLRGRAWASMSDHLPLLAEFSFE